MRFPGPRIAKYYFPVTGKATQVAPSDDDPLARWYAVGLDEVLVDVEVQGSYALAAELGFVPGDSVRISDDTYRELLARFAAEPAGVRFTPGGTVANTLCNFTHLSGEPALLLGTIEDGLRPRTPGFAYVAQTPTAVSLDHLKALPGHTGVAITFVTPDGERAFGVAPGVAGDYGPEDIPAEVVANASIVVVSLYCFINQDKPIAAAAMRLLELAREAGVPVAFGLGAASLVRTLREQVLHLLSEYVSVAAMNRHEAEALTGQPDALLACDQLLDHVDMVLITEGSRGLTLAGWTDDAVKRETRLELRSKSIPDYNRWEFSRAVRRTEAPDPIKVYSHIHPFRGGPDQLTNTSGAGDAALAALLHDVVANRYHRVAVPDSRKHPASFRFLTYSSLSRNAQYCNRVAYEVLRRRSPRLEGPVGHDEDDQGTVDRSPISTDSPVVTLEPQSP